MALPGIQSDDSSGAAGGISPDQAGQLDQPTNPRGEQGLTVQQKIAQMVKAMTQGNRASGMTQAPGAQGQQQQQRQGNPAVIGTAPAPMLPQNGMPGQAGQQPQPQQRQAPPQGGRPQSQGGQVQAQGGSQLPSTPSNSGTNPGGMPQAGPTSGRGQTVADLISPRIGALVQQVKQQKFAKEGEQAKVLALAQLYDGKKQRGEQPTEQEIRANQVAQDPKFKSKSAKIAEQMVTDPTSAAYQAAAAVVDGENKRVAALEEQQLKMENMRQQAFERKQIAEWYASRPETDAAKVAATAAAATDKSMQKTQTVMGADNKPHVMGWNPQTKAFDRDQGVTQSKSPIKDVQSQIQEAMTSGDTASAQRLQQTLGAMYKQNINDKVVSILSKSTPMTDEDKRFLKGVQGMTQMTKTDPAVQAGVARANAFAGARRLPVVGDNGEVTYMRADEAEKAGMQTPQSVSFVAMKDADIYFKSGKGGQMLTNIKTADRHIAQLRRIAQALNNKERRLANALGNQYAIETGSSSAPLDFQGVSVAVDAELAKTATGGIGTKAMTDALGQAYSEAKSPQAIDSVLNNFHELMQSKRAELMTQWKEAGHATNFKDDMAKPVADRPTKPSTASPTKVGTTKPAHDKPKSDPLGLFE